MVAEARNCLGWVGHEGTFQGDNDLYFISHGGYAGIIQLSKFIILNI